MPEKKPTIYIEGVCPYCESENIDYDDNGIYNDCYYYNMICRDCGRRSIEWYILEFDQTEGVD